MKAVVYRQYGGPEVLTFTEIVEAHRHVDTGRKRGNVVITVEG